MNSWREDRYACSSRICKRNRAMRTALVVLACVVIIGCNAEPRADKSAHPRSNRPYASPPVAFDGDSKGLKQSVISPTLDAPMPEGKNVIWCATFQMAWNRLRDDVIEEPVRVANAESVADRLNKAVLADNDLPDGSFYAAAGFAKDGIAERIRREMQERFQKEPTDL